MASLTFRDHWSPGTAGIPITVERTGCMTYHVHCLYSKYGSRALVMTLPNFLIIGMPKAGTTSLYNHFREHPQIFMPRIKEPRFFGYEGSRPRGIFPIQSLEEYKALFEEVTTETAVGEASPHYMVYPGAPRRIHDLIPGARLIASLRNPVDRSYSTYQMNLRNQGTNRGIPFGRAIDTDPNLQDTYHAKLVRFFDLFPAEQIRVILLDDLEARPQATVQDLFGFLGVDTGFVPDLSKISNPGGEPRIRLLHDVLGRAEFRRIGRAVLPEGAINRLRDLRSRNLRKVPLSPEDRARAGAFFREDILKTQDLIRRDLSHWMTV